VGSSAARAAPTGRHRRRCRAGRPGTPRRGRPGPARLLADPVDASCRVGLPTEPGEAMPSHVAPTPARPHGVDVGRVVRTAEPAYATADERSHLRNIRRSCGWASRRPRRPVPPCHLNPRISQRPPGGCCARPPSTPRRAAHALAQQFVA
jgi:hypothetical protein